MTDGPGEGGLESRLGGDLPVVDAATAAGDIAEDATLLVSGFGSVGYPKAVPQALADSGRDLALTVVSGGSVGPEIDEALVEAGAMERRYPFVARQPVRDAIDDGRIAFADRHVSGVGDEVRFGDLVDPDVAVIEAVAVGEDWLIPSTSIGQTPAFVDAADALVVEVNRAQPRSLAGFHDVYRQADPPDREPVPLSAPGERIGDPAVGFDPAKLAAVVETDSRDQPYTFREPTADDEAIAENLAAFLAAEVDRSPLFEDTLRLQFGVGSLGNALMSAVAEADVGDRDLVYFGEVIQDGLLDLLDDGDLAVASATSLALSAAGQERLFANADRYVEDVVLRPTPVSNDAGLIERFGVVAINSALEVDLAGHANATHVGGTRLVNGIGGGGDFMRHAALSILALPSTAGDGDVSRIVPMATHVDHVEHDVDVVITEQGVADLRGASPRERAAALIAECAHPSFREDLQDYHHRARSGGGHEPHDLGTAFDWQR